MTPLLANTLLEFIDGGLICPRLRVCPDYHPQWNKE